MTDEVCNQFKKDNTQAIMHRRPACINRPCTSTDYSKLHSDIDLTNVMLYKDIDNFGVRNPTDTVVDTPASPPVFESLRAVPRIANGPKILGA